MTIPFFPRLRTLSGAFVTTALLGSLLVSVGCSKSPAQIEKKDLGLGQHYLSEGKVNEAIIEFQNALKVNPKSVKGRLGLATSYMKKGWTAEAVLEFQEVTKEDPLNLPAHLALVRYGVNSSQWNAVKPEIAAVLKIDPNNVEGLSAAGERDLALGREKEAEVSFKKALAQSPGAVSALVGMGDLLRRENHPKQSADDYDRALTSDPKNARALTGLGSLAQVAGKTDEAKAFFRKAMDADKSDLRSRIVYANFLAGQGHADQAVALLKAVPAKAADLRIPVKLAEYEVLLGQNAKAIALMHPLELQKIPLPDIYLVLAKAYQNSGRLPEALEEATKLSTMEGIPPVMKIVAARVEMAGQSLGKAKNILNSISETPHLPVSYWQTFGQLEEIQKNPEQAIKVLNKGLKKYPDSNILLLSLADAQAMKNNYEESVRILDRLLEKDPKNPAIIGRLGNLKGRKNGTKAEVTYYREMSRRYPDVTGIEFLYLLSLASSKHLPDAIGEAKAYLVSNPSNQQIRFLLAQFELQSGRRAEAIELYKSILGADPKNLQALHALADQELAERHFPEAESLFRRSLAIQPEDSNLEVGLGEALLAENQKEAAEKAFHQALLINPNQPLALLESAKNAIILGRNQEAGTYLTPLMKVNFPPKQKAQVQWLWGLANERSGKANVAFEALSKAVHLDSENALYRETLGEYWESLLRWDKALPELEKAVSLNPKNQLLALKVEWEKLKAGKRKPEKSQLKRVVSLANNYHKSHPQDLTSALIEAKGDFLLNKINQSLSIYDNILLSYPDNFPALLGKASILLAQGHQKQSEKFINQILSKYPNDLRANLFMVSIDRKKNDVKGMVEHLERIHQMVPTWVDPAVSLAAADLYLKHFEEAKSIAFTIHENHPELKGVYLIQASSEMGLGEFRNAERDYVALAIHEKHPGEFYNLASVAAEKAGDVSHAVKYLDMAYKSSPNDPAILNNLAFSLADRKTDLPKALVYAKKALEKAPQPFIQDTVGYVLYRMGRFNRAENHFMEAYKVNFRDPEFLFHMGLNEWKLGMKEKSENLLRKALTSGKLSQEEQEEAHRALGEVSKI